MTETRLFLDLETKHGNVDLLSHTPEENEPIPNIGEFIELDDYYEYEDDLRGAYGSLFKVILKRLGYSVHEGSLPVVYIRLILMQATKEEEDYIYGKNHDYMWLRKGSY